MAESQTAHVLNPRKAQKLETPSIFEGIPVLKLENKKIA